MKNLIPLFIAVLFALSSCKKEHKDTNPPPDTGKKYEVTFNVNNPEVQTHASKTKVNATSAGSGQGVKYLYYMVLNDKGTIVRTIVQDSSTFNFGVVADAFFPGTYTLIFFASQYVLQDDVGYLRSYRYIQQPEKHDDFFYKKMTITVTDANINQEVTLERMGAKLQIVLEDAIPADVTSIYITYTDFITFSFFDNFLTAPTGTNHIEAFIKPADVGKLNYTLSTILYKTSAVFNSPKPITVTIIARSPLGRYKMVTVNDVLCERSQVTTLKGKIFQDADPDYNSGFQITLDPDWGPTTTTTF